MVDLFSQDKTRWNVAKVKSSFHYSNVNQILHCYISHSKALDWLAMIEFGNGIYSIKLDYQYLCEQANIQRVKDKLSMETNLDLTSSI